LYLCVYAFVFRCFIGNIVTRAIISFYDAVDLLLSVIARLSFTFAHLYFFMANKLCTMAQEDTRTITYSNTLAYVRIFRKNRIRV